MLSTPYSLPFAVRVQRQLAHGTHDVSVRIVMDQLASHASAKALHATVLPFLLLLSSGALAGESIEPWTSTVEDWSDPSVQPSTIEWRLASVTCDLRAWVVLAQMLLIDHPKHPIARIDIADARQPNELMEVLRGQTQTNPYPMRWSGIDFAVEFYDELDKEFTACVSFVRPLSGAEQERVGEALFAWAPGLIQGAYGVAPVPPDSCIGLPDRDIVFVDNELEWIIRNFTAHTGAIEGLINVVASLSHQVAQVTQFRIE
jgi:hypothetical protein